MLVYMYSVYKTILPQYFTIIASIIAYSTLSGLIKPMESFSRHLYKYKLDADGSINEVVYTLDADVP